MSHPRIPSPPALDPTQCGPEYWERRRAEWLTPPPGKAPNPSREQPASLDPQQRLVDILDEPGASENDAYWFGGLQRIWKALIGCAIVKHPLPLRTATRLLHTGWLRDGTWPRGATATSSTDEESLGVAAPTSRTGVQSHSMPVDDATSATSTAAE